MKTCYMCDSPATSREHAPPICFFPDAKSIGEDLRKNLITVPSCDEHNSSKSKDDEFFRSVVLMISAQSSTVGRTHFFGKHIRGVQRSPKVYRDFYKKLGYIASKDAHVLKTDRERLDQCVDHLARAIFYHAFNTKWPLIIGVASPNFYEDFNSEELLPHQDTMKAVKITQELLQYEPIKGDNPEVFKYRIQYDEKDEAFAFAAQFYDSFEVYTFSSNILADAAL